MSHFERELRMALEVYRQNGSVEVLAESVALAILHSEIVENDLAMEILKILKRRKL